ncbi:hypothetical protein C1645_838816 [Glomus cerebriforme]|uniref:Crinkler effector protein N-terminal domain-containing protein n=1 Tax=Glomus cerebriforme TaxID=658196 RepID=A0A397S6J8_9GLOM|nr:hypothetical protein C1645_838816 [Glomus cerebriforme]
MSTITLSCLVVDENSYDNVFNIKVNKIEMVNELRDAIKKKIDNNVKADSYDQLPCIKIGSLATPEEIRNSMIEDFLRMYKAFPPITSTNEATRCEFISAIIYGMTSIFDDTVKVYLT